MGKLLKPFNYLLLILIRQKNIKEYHTKQGREEYYNNFVKRLKDPIPPGEGGGSYLYYNALVFLFGGR